jgi:hypothetical protein
MPNPFLPLWEYVPDGEPKVFGDRVYLYGSHDRVNSDSFCDFKLKVWSAPISDLNKWECHGDIFHTADDRDHKSDVNWTQKELYAPDVVFKNGKFYLFAYILQSKGCVGVSDKPEGPFKLISRYKYSDHQCGDDGEVNDVGVLADDDGKVYIYYGFQRSWMNQINPDNMYEIIDGTLLENIIPEKEPFNYFEASSPRKINGIYYLIYSQKPPFGSRLAYATSDSPTGPFQYRGYIIDNGVDFPAGNNHGSICQINGQWYVFYHRMTNNTITSRRACVEKIQILPDGTIPAVEMTSLGFEESLSPYKITPAEIACVMKGGCFVTEKDIFTRPITNIKKGCILGYKYFDFGNDYSSKTMLFFAEVIGMGSISQIKILIDDYENGEEIGVCDIGTHDGVYKAVVKNVTGRHAVFFLIDHSYGGWFVHSFKEKTLFDLISFVFVK